MKSKIYNIALATLISLAVCGVANAQKAAPVPATPAVPPTAVITPTPQVYVLDGQTYAAATQAYGAQTLSIAPQLYTVSPDVYLYGSKDTVYREKMRKLREQMSALNKEMSQLNTEERRKNSALLQEKLVTMRKMNSARFDSTFNKNFNRTFTSNLRFNFDTNTNLEKQVQSGEVKEKSKTFSKSYTVDGNDKLQIDNRYGKINVNTWNKNEVKVDVDIKAYANEDADAQKLIDQTTINSSKDDNIVAFKTDIDQGTGNTWWGTMTQNGKITKVRKVIINYTVYMPAKNPLTINNRYGAVTLPDLSGKITINNSYGGLVAKDLTNSDNTIAVRYGDVNIGSLNGSELSVAYGSLALASADNLNATISYSPAKIGKLNTSGTITLKYGDGLVIGDLGKQLKSLTVNSSYAPVKFASMAGTNADFDVTVHYSDFMYNNNAINVTSQTPDKEHGFTSTKNYKGHIGKGNSDKMIVVKANYGGGVKFEQ